SAIIPVPLSQLPGFRLALPGLGDTTLVPPKLLVPRPDVVDELDLDELALEGLRRRIEERERYARIQVYDADTTDAESRNRRRARQVVERAIEAMGGMDSLLAIREMRAHVWIEASEHVIPATLEVPMQVYPRAPYAYPVARWFFKGWDTFVEEPIRVEASTDPAVVNPPYVFLNPRTSLTRYDLLFPNQWAILLPEARQLREQGRGARWHFVDRFLGEGVSISYVGRERYRSPSGPMPVDVIQVNDRQYGDLIEALFDRDTGLLTCLREGLNPEEEERYRVARSQRRGGVSPRANVPTWDTQYDDYRPVNGVLTAHLLRRIRLLRGSPPIKVTVRLKVAYNGAFPDASPPELD
ncbi:hypothetical protein ACFL6X_04305, partial [Candidatus Latescibacterota bacterium]